MSDNQNPREATRQTRDFLQVLGDMPNTVDALTEKWQELADAVRDTGKKGTITLVLTALPQKGDETIKTVTPLVKVALPQVPLKPVIMFDQPDGTLARSNPAVSLFDMGDDIRSAPSRDTDAPIKEARS